jgi:hypothetical protein
MREFLIQGRATVRFNPSIPPFNIDEMRRGRDEQEALASYLRDCKRTINVSADELFVQVLIRPTGRISTRVFDEQAKEITYNRRIISRFWVRFHLSETEEELKRYGDDFARFVQYRKEAGEPFREDSIEKMREKYQTQLSLIQSGYIKPLDYKIKREGKREPIEVVSERAANYLRLFGFRVEKKGKTYHVQALPSQNFLYAKALSEELDPLGLILFFEWKMREREMETEPAYRFLGYVMDGHQDEHLKALQEKNLEVYLQKDDVGVPMLYVAKEDEMQAKTLLYERNARLTNDYTDPFLYEYDSDPLGETYYYNLDNMFEK